MASGSWTCAGPFPTGLPCRLGSQSPGLLQLMKADAGVVPPEKLTPDPSAYACAGVSLRAFAGLVALVSGLLLPAIRFDHAGPEPKASSRCCHDE